MNEKIPEGTFYPTSPLGEIHGVYIFSNGAIHCGSEGMIAKFSDGKMFAIKFSDLKKLLEKGSKYDNLI